MYEDIYDAVFIYDNKIMHSIDLNDSDYQRRSSGSFAKVLSEDKCFDLRTEVIDKQFGKNEELTVAYEIFESILVYNSSSYFQDGIKIECGIDHLIPIGYFKIDCNCTADVRMALNVTRHKVSELKQDVEQWCNTVGKLIQQKTLMEFRKQWSN